MSLQHYNFNTTGINELKSWCGASWNTYRHISTTI